MKNTSINYSLHLILWCILPYLPDKGIRDSFKRANQVKRTATYASCQASYECECMCGFRLCTCVWVNENMVNQGNDPEGLTHYGSVTASGHLVGRAQTLNPTLLP